MCHGQSCLWSAHGRPAAEPAGPRASGSPSTGTLRVSVQLAVGSSLPLASPVSGAVVWTKSRAATASSSLPPGYPCCSKGTLPTYSPLISPAGQAPQVPGCLSGPLGLLVSGDSSLLCPMPALLCRDSSLRAVAAAAGPPGGGRGSVRRRRGGGGRSRTVRLWLRSGGACHPEKEE